MATNLAIDDKLLEEARIVGKHATKKAVVNEALAEYIQRRKQAELSICSTLWNMSLITTIRRSGKSREGTRRHTVWSLELRRNAPPAGPEVVELIELIREVRVQMIGPVRQALLSGIRHKAQFEKLCDQLRTFPDLELGAGDYETAAEFYNLCRAGGIQGSNTGFLICAVAAQNNLPIFTTDRDFSLFQRHVPIALHFPRS